MNQIFIIIFLLKNIKSKKIYEYKFFGTQTHFNKSVLGLALVDPTMIGRGSVSSPGYIQGNDHTILHGTLKKMTIFSRARPEKWPSSLDMLKRMTSSLDMLKGMIRPSSLDTPKKMNILLGTRLKEWASFLEHV